MKLYLTLALFLALTLSPCVSWGQFVNPVISDEDRENTAAGTGALLNNGGVANTAFGLYTLFNNTFGTNNVGLGGGALFRNTLGDGNTALGLSALFNNDTGYSNTATGLLALQQNTIGFENTAAGVGVMQQNISGSHNGAAGYYTLQANTTGYGNTADGHSALFRNTTGHSNTATGLAALFTNTTGVRNTATGVNALVFNTTGYANTAEGVEALLSSTTGFRNTALGTQAGLVLTSGNNNLFLGWASGNALTSGSNNIYAANPGVANESATLRLGNVQTRAFIAGIKGVPISGATVTINNAGQLGILASSRRFKEDIAPMNGQSADLYKLRPVTYSYKADEDHQRQYGLIAEEVAEVYPEIVVKDSTGQVESLQYNALIPMLINELQKQQKQIAALQAQVDRLVKK